MANYNMSLFHKLQKKLKQFEDQRYYNQEILNAHSHIKTIDDHQTRIMQQFMLQFYRQINIYKEQETLLSKRIYQAQLTKQQITENLHLQNKILEEQKKGNEELKKCEETINQFRAFNDQCQTEIENESFKMKQSKDSLFKEDGHNQPVRHFQRIKNRLNVGKGVCVDQKQNRITLRVQKSSEHQNVGEGELVEYELIFSNQHQKFVPGGNYPKDIIKVIGQYNFHLDLAKLQQDLQELSQLCHYS